MAEFSELLKKQSKFFYEEVEFTTEFRINALVKLAQAIKDKEEDIQKALKKDLGKSSYESFLTEIGIILHEINFIRKNLRKWNRAIKVKTSQWHLFYSKSYIVHEPRGQVLIYSPWNYPFQLVMSPLIGALAAGNTVVIKPSEHAPATADVIDELIRSIFPEKYVAVIKGDAKIAHELIQLDWDMIFFTGSTVIGKKIYASAAEKLIPVVLELGGKCPVIVNKDANLKVTAKRIIWAKILNAGQTCVAPDYILVHKLVEKQLLKLLKEQITQMLGRKINNSPTYARIVNRSHFERLTKLLENTHIYFGGAYNAEDLFFAPTIVEKVQPSHPLMQEEIFGPILPVLSYENIDEAIVFANRQYPSLAVYCFTSSNKTFEQVQQYTQSGAIIKNDALIYLSNLNLPFGGVRQSGLGRYHGKQSFETFSNQRSVLKHATWCDPSVRYPPYTAKKWKLLRKLLD